jgi:hypothetical protein
MPVLNREEYLARIQKLVGEDTSDDAMSTIEDFTDTFNSLSANTPDGENWEKKYKDNDDMWRKKYRDRFFSGDEQKEYQQQHQHQKEEEQEKEVSFSDLFK